MGRAERRARTENVSNRRLKIWDSRRTWPEAVQGKFRKSHPFEHGYACHLCGGPSRKPEEKIKEDYDNG